MKNKKEATLVAEKRQLGKQIRLAKSSGKPCRHLYIKLAKKGGES